MLSYCPKCEKNKLNHGICSKCNYSIKARCVSCGHYNMPSAKFCGICGEGIALSIRVKQLINRNTNYLQRFRIRKFATGISFGILLTIFAFSSVGMRSNNIKEDAPYNLKIPLISEYRQQLSKAFDIALTKQMIGKNQNTYAKIDDLSKTVDLLIEHLQPLLGTLVNTPINTASDYIKNLKKLSKKNRVTRGNNVMVLFYFLSDFLNLQYRNFPQESAYLDIPKFHFLAVPINALKKFDIGTEFNNEEFGINNSITLTELNITAKKTMRAIESHFMTGD